MPLGATRSTRVLFHGVRVGVSRQAVSKRELGDATPEVDKLLALARTFGVTTDELLRESDPAESPEQVESSRAES